MASAIITVKDKDYIINNDGFYPIMLFKRTKGYNFDGQTAEVDDLIALIWCYLKVNDDFTLSLEEFEKISNKKMVDQFNKMNEQPEEDQKKVM